MLTENSPSPKVVRPPRTPWSPGSWRTRPIEQAPAYNDTKALAEVEKKLLSHPGIVEETEVLELKEKLALAEKGEAFLFQAGDCAESFCEGDKTTVEANVQMLLFLAARIQERVGQQVITVGRLAGQYAKPRSRMVETRDGLTLPAYRGDLINGHDFTFESRIADPARMETAYRHSTTKKKWLPVFTKGQALYTSHEALLLNYEESLLRACQGVGDFYASSAHFLWVGERTKALDGAHVEFLKGITNPIGIKCGPNTTSDELLRLLDTLNPAGEAGKIVLITRFGEQAIQGVLPGLIRGLKAHGREALWCCDPMHGNTFTTNKGTKTRLLSAIKNEFTQFMDIHRAEGSHAGGLHLEVTAMEVLECLQGPMEMAQHESPPDLYLSLCDPRLNASQAVELIDQVLPTLAPAPSFQ